MRKQCARSVLQETTLSRGAGLEMSRRLAGTGRQGEREGHPRVLWAGGGVANANNKSTFIPSRALQLHAKQWPGSSEAPGLSLHRPVMSAKGRA